MKRKNGFTLIELLAVIVILAIIVLIATPIVLNIIKDSKDSATLQSAQFYIDAVENAMVKEMLDGSKIENGYYTVMEDGNLCLELNSDRKTCKKGLIEVEVSGKVPEKGTIIIIGSNLKEVDLLVDNKKIFKYNGQIVFNNGVIKPSDNTEICTSIRFKYPIPKHVYYDAILDGTTIPTIPAKVKYKNGKSKDVTLYYIGTGYLLQYGGLDPTQIGTWKYFENGEVTKNANGTYSGTGDGITLYGNVYDDGDMPDYSSTAHFVDGDFLDTYESVEIFGDIVDHNYMLLYRLTTAAEIVVENGKIIELGEKTPIPFFTDGTKVKNIIMTFEDGSQKILNLKEDTNLELDITNDNIDISNEFEGFNIHFEKSGMASDFTFWLSDLKLSNLIIEEEVDGKLEKKTFNIENYTVEQIEEMED